ncbi:putative drug exporter of the RND superfamily [Amycolatopsis marina]|uniref:Putative drug exporter of the RND superfamily n=1 Tax=Amycolatopsis marina TaxID=490629 RepID=A0A1I1AH17_9PSEU|nr:MMPL family transporter [Amycolatopsis marina]SFB36782.1 putative drug exporter of the RND superfamily [Amycolatopsis marina]
MATFLYRVGRFAFRRRVLVLSVWAAVLVAFGAGALTLSGQMTNSVSIPGTESQQAIDHLKERFPQAAAGGTARVAIAAPEGESLTDPVNKAAVDQVVEQLRTAPEVVNVADPFQTGSVSPDGHVALAQVSYQKMGFELTEADREALLDAADPGRDAGLQVEFGGDAMQSVPGTEPTEIIGVLVAALVLAITFGSIVAAGLPLLTALVGVGIGMAGILITSGFLDLNANTPVLALMIGLAVGIDYALFIVSRYRHELSIGRSPEGAAARAVGTAGSAVVFAGLTVIIALAGLTVVGIPFLGEMGVAASVTVAIAVLIALTLLPALLGFAGTKVLGRRRGKQDVDAPTFGSRWATFVARHRVPVLAAAILGLAVVAIPAASMQLGLPNDSTAAPNSTQRQAYDLVSSGFGPGANGPLTVVVDVADASDPQGAAAQAAANIGGLDDVATVAPPQFNPQGDTALLNVIPKSGPSSEATENLVSTIRDQGASLSESTGATLAVTGQTAMNIDVSDKLANAMLPYLALIVGLAFILLMLVFRSVIVPLKATLGFLGSVAATFGAVVAVFQWGWLNDLLGVEANGPIMSMLPILLIGVLFGLAMDYQVFLVTRMREEHVHGAAPDDAMITGFRHGSRVVVAAALIMISVFAGFVLSSETLIQSIGFALAFGVLVDAFVVRMTIVPALMSLLGTGAWWLPNWLNRLLPNVDVEGEGLSRALDGEDQRDKRVLEPSH